MPVRYVLAGIVTVLGLAFAAPSSAAVDQLDPNQWDIGSVAPIASMNNADFTFRDLRISGSTNILFSHHRTFGVDLDFSNNGQKVSTGYHQFSFKRASGVAGGIAPTENVALYDNFTHKYLVNGHENFGIDLQWRDIASYEWRVNVVHGQASLYNTRRGDYVVYGKESFGIDLVWLKDLSKTVGSQTPLDRTATVFLTAQPVISGFVPFSGSFNGGGPGATLKSVGDPFSNIVVFFVKPGHNTTECGDPNAVVPLGSGARFNSTQMQAAFGAPTPRLPINFVACVAAAANISSIPLNIVYHGIG